MSVAFSRDSELLAASSYDNVVRIYGMKAGGKPSAFSLHTFRYKGLLNCANEHRGELCWESADVRAERPRPLLLLFVLVAVWFSASNEQPR